MTPEDIDRIIEMAWEDRTPFDAITAQFGISEKDTIQLMRQQLQPKSFRRWRARVQGRATKHLRKRSFATGRHRCSRQRSISQNKIT
ncbi:MAG: TIGR03643 family protein [Bernardetiaceae bacterium]